ncbi:MAG TPA: fibrinogen-like YCDxxxxGGGW domain-containing protein [Acidimicrobiia bacterium]|jgi:hypothetical protein
MLRRPLSAALTIALASIATIAAVAPSTAHAGGPTVHAGLTSDDAAPSCWAIKQSFPSSPSGLYWLETAALVQPQQFYCDMTTDGGGWVLVGRGRNGWKWKETGQNSAANLRATITGEGAFAPATLPDKVVNGLLAGTRPDQLQDGIRIIRATNSNGTSSQEMRWNLTNTATWTWEFAGGEMLSSYSFGSGTLSANGATTQNTGTDNAFNRSILDSGHKQTMGFAFGSQIGGNSSPTSYLAPATSNNSGAVPFAQVWIRPEIDDTMAGFTAVADAGTAAQTLSWLPVSQPQTFQWGVVGVQKVADPDPDNDAPAQALAQVGNTMFVGGKFAAVQNGAGGPQYNQPWLAAFDVSTGAWISTFRPTLDGTVFTMAAAPNGDLIVGGNFTNVNGAPNTSGLAELDPTTGQVVPGFTAFVTNPRFNAPRPFVRNVAIYQNWLYVVGGFNRITGGPTLKTVTPMGVGRVSLTDGTPDNKWKVPVDLTPISVSPSSDGTRVYLAGFFHNVDNTPGIDSAAVVDTVTGALIPGMNRPQFDQGSSHNWYQYSIFEYAGNIYLGGSQHDIQEYTHDNFSYVTGHVGQWGGDYQAMTAYDGVIFGGCHCYFYDYANTDTWPTPTNYTQVTTSNWLNAFDANGLTKETDFEPQWAMANSGEGVWGLTVDSDGCLWAAGDMDRGALHGNVYDWLGGFARFCSRDTTAPTTPTNLKVSGSNIVWTPSTDNSGAAPTYEVIRNDRVVEVTGKRQIPSLGPGRYFVRAIDATGNRSASTTVLTVS